jgi:Tol biopolymer transport system component
MKMFSINDQKNHARQLLGLVLATVVLTTLVVRPVHSVTQQHAASALGPVGQTKRRRVHSATQRDLARAGQNKGAANHLTQPQTTALRESGKIAFNRYTGEVTAIFTMNADGSEVTQITDDQYFNFDPAWSPDGTKIAFDTFRNNGDYEICLMNADGSNQAGFTPPAFGIDPAWSPNGRKIAYWNFDGIISVMNADGSNQTTLTNGAAFDLEPSWSPDGSKIAFSSYRDGQTEIYVMNADGSNQTRFTNDVVNYDEEPAWSPDGSRIAFTKYLDCIDFGFGIYCGGAQIMIMQADGSNPTYLTGGEDFAWSSFSTWSPDGTQLAFEGYVVGEVYAIRADGSGLVDLTNNDADDFFPSWGPVASPPAPCPNPIDCAEFFVRQHYQDFLNREPDDGGLAYWTNELTKCGTDARCVHQRRIGVSGAFFVEMEFQDTGYYVYRFYKASFGRQPNYPEFSSDRSKVIGGSSLEANKQAFADEWVQRQAFRDAYPNTMSNTEFVNKVFDSAGLSASIYDPQRQQEIEKLNAGLSRALVLREVIEIPDFKNIPDPKDPRFNEIKQTSQYNSAFVLMQYFGYLRRDVDPGGYDFWLDVVNNREPNNYAGMVCAFITSSEYQLRFGQVVTRSNADCSR